MLSDVIVFTDREVSEIKKRMLVESVALPGTLEYEFEDVIVKDLLDKRGRFGSENFVVWLPDAC